jgi:hypothetical protein
MSTNTVTTHIKKIFIFPTGIAKLYNSDDSVTQLIHISHFFTVRFTNPQKKKSREVKPGERENQGMGPVFTSNYQKTP